ncbi:MAG: DUF1015 domain-containing protein [Gemmatimonadales bacterium]
MQLRAFRAWRPDPKIADRVAAPPYDVVGREEARLLAEGNPFSFLHVGRSDIDLPDEVDAYDPRVYAKARDHLQAFMLDGTLIQEREPSLYLYELTLAGRSQVGLVGCVHVDDYERDVIKKHEKTRPDKEADRTRHLVVSRAHAEPVFLTYSGQPIVDRLNATEMRAAPLYDFVSDDGVRHRVWRVRQLDEYLDAFRRIPEAYVADGHHRSASAWRAARELAASDPAAGSDAEHNWFLAVLFPASQLQILPYNRVVADLGGRSAAAFRAELEALGTLTPTDRPTPDKSGVICLFLEGQWLRLELDPATINAADPIKSLDAELLSDRILGPLLGIQDIRTDKRVDFVGGIRGTTELERRVRSGEAAVAFSLYPVQIEQVMSVAAGGGVMPPKSTWFEPKLKSGLFVHTFD